MAEKAKYDIICNWTKICPFDCVICCVDAVHVTRHGSEVCLRSHGLENEDRIEHWASHNIYDEAAAHLQAKGLELTQGEKLRIIESLRGHDVRVDFSGGDCMAGSEAPALLKAACEALGRENVTLTATGVGLARHDPALIAQYISELNITVDMGLAGQTARPSHYATSNLRLAATYARLGVSVRGELPLTNDNVDEFSLRKVYLALHKAGIKQLLLMRLFPVGRGQLVQDSVPDTDAYKRAIAILRAEEARVGTPRIRLQCALRHIEGGSSDDDPCDMLNASKGSYGLTPTGELLASPWAYDRHGKPLADWFVLGSLLTESLSSILASDRVAAFRTRTDGQFGHCKMQAYLSNERGTTLDRLFAGDPLYSPKPVPTEVLSMVGGSGGLERHPPATDAAMGL